MFLYNQLTAPQQARGLRVCAVGRPPRSGSSRGGSDGGKQEKGRWRGMDAGVDMSDDQVRRSV